MLDGNLDHVRRAKAPACIVRNAKGKKPSAVVNAPSARTKKSEAQRLGATTGFRALGLTLMTYSNGFAIWHYRTNDKPELVLSGECGNPDYTGYFAPACDLLRRGDQIIVSFGGGPEPDLMTLIVTEAVPCGYVTVRELYQRQSVQLSPPAIDKGAAS